MQRAKFRKVIVEVQAELRKLAQDAANAHQREQQLSQQLCEADERCARDRVALAEAQKVAQDADAARMREQELVQKLQEVEQTAAKDRLALAEAQKLVQDASAVGRQEQHALMQKLQEVCCSSLSFHS